MKSRREFVKLAANLGVVSIFVDCGIKAATAGVPQGIGLRPDYDGQLPRQSVLGTQPPKDAEERIARSIISQAPKGPTPVAVARYFLAIGEGQLGPAWVPYVWGGQRDGTQ